MTAIQVKYLEYLENRRKNLRSEELTADQIQLDKQKLAETIANNLRNYHVNVEKNEIQRLYNDDLNDREKQKLAEQIRSNLANENTKLFEALEKQRHQMTDEQIRKEQNVIKVNEMLINALTSGKSNDIGTSVFNWLKGLASADVITGGSITQRTWNYAIKALDSIPQTSNGDASPTTKVTNNGKKVDTYDPITGEWTYSKNSTNRKKDDNEIPADYSQSSGPQATSPTNRIQTGTVTPAIVSVPSNGQTRDQQATANYNKAVSAHPVTSPNTGRSNVIIVPGTKINFGPGF